MTVRKAALWRKVLAWVPVLLVMASIPEHALLRCRMDGELRAACCCHRAGETSTSEPSGPAVSKPCCCDRVVVGRSVAPFASGRGPAPVIQVAIPVVCPAYAVLAAPALMRAARDVRGGGPAREGPTLLVWNQTFLI
jgi:hypothetical protein